MSEFRATTCDEAVTRRGELQPCDLPAVAVRQDPETGGHYPVCTKHTRTPSAMVPLVEVLAAFSTVRSAREEVTSWRSRR